MFRKLVKHEFIATRRIVPFIWLAVVVMAAIHLISGQMGIGWLSTTAFVFLLLLAFGQVLITYAVIVTRYYKSLYSDEGYLTHTLPVKAGELLGSKLLTSFIWLILSYFISAFVILIVLFNVSRQQDTTLLLMYQEVKQAIGLSNAQVTLAGFMVLGFLTYTLLLQLAQLFFAMSFGSRAQMHRLGLAGPIVSYLILNFFLEMLMLVGMFFIPFGLELKLNAAGVPNGGFNIVAHGMFELIRNSEDNRVIFGLGGFILTLIAMAALYWGTHQLIKKHTSLR